LHDLSVIFWLMPAQLPHMPLRKYRLLALVAAACYLLACQQHSGSEIASDPHSIRRGQYYYDLYCSSCHSLNNQSIGPALAGITGKEGTEWLKSFIRDAPALIDSGDKRAKALFASYRQYMPAFPMLQDSNIDCIWPTSMPNRPQRLLLQTPSDSQIPFRTAFLFRIMW